MTDKIYLVISESSDDPIAYCRTALKAHEIFIAHLVDMVKSDIEFFQYRGVVDDNGNVTDLHRLLNEFVWITEVDLAEGPDF